MPEEGDKYGQFYDSLKGNDRIIIEEFASVLAEKQPQGGEAALDTQIGKQSKN